MSIFRQWLAASLCILATAATSGALLTPPEHRRGPDQTFLTFPEWYLVHSPAEYAAYLRDAAHPSQFPLFAHIAQFWQGYGAVAHEIRRYPFNGGYHLMVVVIGTSTTVEYALKGIYEHTIGRLAEATRTGDAPVPEEVFAARFAQAYVDFIRVEPWYLFDFWSQFKALWSDVPASGPNLMRRWERRFLLSTELLVKEGYAHIIKWGTQSIYDAPKPVTAVVLSRSPDLDARYPDFLVLKSYPDGTVLATIPRYEDFTRYSEWLAEQGIGFREIAGNSDEVVVSVWVPDHWTIAASGVRLLFTQPIVTHPGTQRAVLAIPVASLAEELRRSAADPRRIGVEHVYDF
jgi:hypothetical protein